MKKVLLVGLTSVFIFCAGCGTISKQYVDADKATYNAVANEYVYYVNSDESLADVDKKIRVDTIRSWEYRIQKFDTSN